MSSFNNYIKDEKINIEPIVTETLDRIDVGGRNLAIYSTADCTNCKKNGDYGFVQTTANTDTTFDLKVLPYLNDTYSGYSLVRTDIVNVGVYKFNAMLTTDCDRINVGANGAKADALSIFYLKETIPSGTELVISLEITNITQGSFSWKNVMIAKGTKAIDWIPAPEDIDNRMDNLQKQIDGEISSWFLEGTPANNYYPASEWTDKTLKERHLGDTYTNMLPSVVNFNDVDANENPLWIEEGFLYMGSTYYGYSFEEQRYIHANGRCRTKSIMELPDVATTFTYPENVQAIVSLYDADKKYVANHNWDLDSPATIPAKSTSYKYFSIGFANDDYSIRLTRADLKGVSCDTTFICPEAGLSWRWCNFDDTNNSTWHWHKIADSDAVKALQDAAKAQQLANNAQSTANTAKTIATGVRQDFDNLEIGGRNLLLNSKPYNNTNWKSNGTSNVTFTEEGTIKCQTNSEWARVYTPQFRNFELKLDDEYTLSMLVRANASGTRKVHLGTGNASIININFGDIPVTTEWSRVIKTAKVINTDTTGVTTWFQIYSSPWNTTNNNDFIEFKEIKLEKGNKATDWTPAPEDLMPNIAGSTGNLIYNDGTKWTTVITPSTDVCNILTIGGGTGSPTWFTGPSAGARGSILTAGGGTGLRWVSVENMRGQKGDTGATGATGPRGVTGLRGVTGVQGTTGSKFIYTGISNVDLADWGTDIAIEYGFREGDFTISLEGAFWYCKSNTMHMGPELRGPQGSQGVTGLRGVTGLQGPRGYTGVTGPRGYTGLRGVTGATGPRGEQGARGYNGPQGATGPIGVGLMGATGLRGVTGATGLKGATGTTGPRGNTGVAGSQYIKTTEAVGSFMTPGNTLASKYGFRIGDFTVTSDRMLLSCVSVTGSSFATITSLSGTTGATGLRGATGTTGATGLRGVTGLQGPRGYTGVTGPRGYTGLRGVTGVGIRMMAECDCTNPGDGYIDDLGDYYVLDEYNEFNLISNLKGPAGTNGSQGARGYTGPRGYTGLRGVTGLRGATGPGGIANSVALGTTNKITATMTNRSSTSYPIISVTGSANAYLYYNSSYNKSIKVYDGQNMLTFTYDVLADSYDTNSDINLKNIVENDLSIEQCYNLINLCSTIIYTLKNGNPDRRYIGMIAQEIELYFPDIVKTNSDGFKSVNYNSIIPICIRVIRDINNRLKNIEDRLYALENKEKGTN